MTNIKPQKGIIGVYDILGYKDFLNNNSFDTAIKDIDNVLKTIANSDEYIKNKVFDIFMKSPNANEMLIKKLLHQMKWFIFSDTIIQVSTFKKDERPGSKYNKWLTFLIASLTLNYRMLKSGLPLRGAITTGNFLFRKLCFAGKPIIEAYELANSLNLSACVITEEAYNKVATLVNSSGYEKTKELFQALIIKYQIPKKKKDEGANIHFLWKILKKGWIGLRNFWAINYKNNQNQESLFTLNLVVPQAPRMSIRMKAIDVRKTFEKHNKRVTEKEISKVENTKKLFEYLIDFAKQVK